MQVKVQELGDAFAANLAEAREGRAAAAPAGLPPGPGVVAIALAGAIQQVGLEESPEELQRIINDLVDRQVQLNKDRNEELAKGQDANQQLLDSLEDEIQAVGEGTIDLRQRFDDSQRRLRELQRLLSGNNA